MKRKSIETLPHLGTGVSYLGGKQLKKINYGKFMEKVPTAQEEGIKFEQYQSSLAGVASVGASWVNMAVGEGCLNSWIEGFEEGRRIDDEVYIKNLHVTFSCKRPAEQTLTQQNHGSMMEIVCFLDKRPHGSLPTMADVMVGAGVGSFQQQVYQGHLSRYNILYHEVLKVPHPEYTFWKVDAEIDEWTYSETTARTEFTIPIDVTTKYATTGAGMTAIETNAIHCYVISNSSKYNMNITWTVNWMNGQYVK